MFIRFQIALTIVLLSTCTSYSQETKTIKEQTQFWWSINTSARLSRRIGVIGDFHIRRDEFIKGSNFFFGRIGGAYWASDRLTLVLGYAHLWLARTNTSGLINYQDENRIYQQIQWRQKINRVTFVQRIRNEQRWHDVLDPQGELQGTRFSNRIRFLSSFNIEIFKNKKLPSIAIADEVHIHFGKEIIYNTFDQNRIFAGLKIPVMENLKCDIGYMMVFQQRFSGDIYDLNHTFRWFFYYSPDFRSDKEGIHYALPGDE